MALRPTLGLITVSTLFLGCQSGPTPSIDTPPQEPAEALVPAATRCEFSAGSFVTYNHALPTEILEAASGQTPARPVLVWAGNEPVRFDANSN